MTAADWHHHSSEADFPLKLSFMTSVSLDLRLAATIGDAACTQRNRVGEDCMTEQQIIYADGVAYERSMGKWSRIAGEMFLQWLAPSPNWSWIDVGCGNGAFTELLFQRCSPQGVTGIDPSDAQLNYARSRSGCRGAEFKKGDAMALPVNDASFDAATMALVIFFVS
jgi:SAM-dependent methyltransferase